MTLNSFINILESLREEYGGDLEVEQYFYGRKTVNTPRIGFRKILKGRESRPDFWETYDGEERKGQMVIRI